MPNGKIVSAAAVIPAAPESQQRSLELVPAHPDLPGKCLMILQNIHSNLVRLTHPYASGCGGQVRIKPCQLSGTQAQHCKASDDIILQWILHFAEMATTCTWCPVGPTHLLVMQADGNSTGVGNPPGYCYREQPAWSAYRESSFGHGTLDVVNGTHALWSCKRLSCP